jgi:hypothetical protein
MNMRLQVGPRADVTLGLGLWLAFAALPVTAQIVGTVGPLTSQTLFFDQAANIHGNNYLEAEAGLVSTDNATLAQNGPGDTLAVVGLAADTSRQGSNLDYHLDSDLALVEYLHEDFPTRPQGYLDGGAELKVVPGLFSWTVRETYSDLVLNPLLPVTAENLESLNYASTGPSLTFRPTLRTSVTVDATYSYVNSGSIAPGYVDLDNHRYAGDVRIDRAVSNSSSLYVSGSSLQVDFSERTINESFDEYDAFAGLLFVDARTIADVAVGYDRLRIAGLTPSGGAYRVALSRLISPRQRLFLHAVQALSDSANLLRLNVDQPVATSAPIQLATGDAMTFRSLGADWRFQAQRTSLDLSVSDNSQRYRLTPIFNNDIKVADILLARQLTPTFDAIIGVDFEHQHFAEVGPQRQVNALTALRWQVGERLGLRLLYAHDTLTSHGNANQVALTAYYGLIRPSQPGLPQGAPQGPVPTLLPSSPMSTQPYPQ